MTADREMFYRIVVDGVGIYEAVDKYCPKDDPRRRNKPDGSWLPKKGLAYPGGVSFWSTRGLQKYRASGLLDWHTAMVHGKIEVLMTTRPVEVLYEDVYQIIVDPEMLNEITRVPLADFLREKHA